MKNKALSASEDENLDISISKRGTLGNIIYHLVRSNKIPFQTSTSKDLKILSQGSAGML